MSKLIFRTLAGSRLYGVATEQARIKCGHIWGT